MNGFLLHSLKSCLSKMVEERRNNMGGCAKARQMGRTCSQFLMGMGESRVMCRYQSRVGTFSWGASQCPLMKVSVLMKVSEQNSCDDAKMFSKYFQFLLVRPLDTGQRKCKCVKRKSFLVQMELAGAARSSHWQPPCDFFRICYFNLNFHVYV